MILRKLDPNMNEVEYLNNIQPQNLIFLNNLANNQFVLPAATPIEIHPYLNEFQLQDYDKYIIGTFPPISYVRDLLDIQNGVGNIPSKPMVPFFHGNDCNMWRLFFNEQEQLEIGLFNNNNADAFRLIQKEIIKEILNQKKINYTDIIYSTKRTDYNPNDQALRNIVPNINLITHILKNKNAKYLNFNTSTIFNNQKLGVNPNNHGVLIAGELKENYHAYNLFIKTLEKLGFKLEVNLLDDGGWISINQENAVLLNENYRYKAFSKLRISTINKVNVESDSFENFEKELIIITGPSPSPQANVAMGGNLVYQNWHGMEQNANLVPSTSWFRKHFYENFINEPENLIDWNI